MTMVLVSVHKTTSNDPDPLCDLFSLIHGVQAGGRGGRTAGLGDPLRDPVFGFLEEWDA